MTSPENQKQQDLKNGCIGCLSVSAILALGVVACSALFSPKEQAVKEKADEWYDKISDNTCERVLKKQLRDPDSYRANSDFLTTEDTGTQKKLTWEFRAKNGFGGYNAGIAVCTVMKDSSSVSVSFENQ
jgi:hypothetical protein